MAKRNTHSALISGLLLGMVVTSGCQRPMPKAAVLGAPTLTANTGGEHVRPILPGANVPGTNHPAVNDPNPANGDSTGSGTATPAVPGLPTTPPTGSTASSGSGGAGSSSAVPSVFGTVGAPITLVSDNGGAIISNNGSAIISNNGGAIISNNGGAIISNNGGAIISNNGGAYRVLDASASDRLLNNAFMYLTDRDEKFFFNTATNQVFTTTTTATGSYRFPIDTGTGFPLGKDVVVNAIVNGNLRLTGYLKPSDRANSLKINLASTVATEFLRGHAYRLGKSLANFSTALFYQAVTLTESAMTSGAIAAVTTVHDKDNPARSVQVGTFDLRLDHLADLRNQYVIALSAVDVANTTIKALSDKWKVILGGVRPTAVTSVAGNGNFPAVDPHFANAGFASGDTSGASSLTGVPIGFNYTVAVSKSGDIFVGGFTEDGGSGNIRWIRKDPDDPTKFKISSIWLPTYVVGSPLGMAIEDDLPAGSLVTFDSLKGTAPRHLLIADNFRNAVFRVAITDDNSNYGDDFNEAFSMQVVAGEPTILDGADTYYGAGSHANMYADHPGIVEPSAYQAVDGTDPKLSRWRLTDEGQRYYEVGDGTHNPGDPIPVVDGSSATPGYMNSARLAHLSLPTDVKVDDLGNIFICEQGNHIVRMIPKVDGHYFGYRRPKDLDNDGRIDGFYAPAEPNPSDDSSLMKAGCIYTIAGCPRWDDAGTYTNQTDGRWLGEYENVDGHFPTQYVGQPTAADGIRAQEAKLDQPYALAVYKTSGGQRSLFIADFDNNRVREVSYADGTISTVAGKSNGPANFGSGDADYPITTESATSPDNGLLPTDSQLSHPRGLAIDANGILTIADTDSGRLRALDLRLAAGSRKLVTVAGRFHNPSSNEDHASDGDATAWADLFSTEKIDVDANGNVLFQDFRHHRLRKLWRQWE